MDSGRVAEVAGARCGSGCLLGGGLVLTAAHLLVPVPGSRRDLALASDAQLADVVTVRRPGDERAYAARRAWARYDGPDRGLDAALLEVTDPDWDDCRVLPLRWGRLEGSAEVRVHAFGFPDAAVRDDQAELVPVAGVVHTASGGQSGRPEMVVDGEPERSAAGGSLWAGLSGGPVLGAPGGVTGDVLIGVVTGDPAEFASRRLRIVPVAAVLADWDAAAVVRSRCGPPVVVGFPEPRLPSGPAGRARPSRVLVAAMAFFENMAE